MNTSYPLSEDIVGGPSSGLEWFSVILTGFVLLALFGAAAERTRRAIKNKGDNFVSIGSICLLTLFTIPTIMSVANTVTFHSFTNQHIWESMEPLLSILYLTIQIEVFGMFQNILKFSPHLRPSLHLISLFLFLGLGFPFYYQLIARSNLLANPVSTGYLNFTSLIAGFYGYLIIVDISISGILLIYLIRNISNIAGTQTNNLIVYQLGSVAVVLAILDAIVLYITFKSGSVDRQFVYFSLLATDIQGIHYICGTYYLNVFSVLRKRFATTGKRSSARAALPSHAHALSSSSKPTEQSSAN